MARDRSKNAYFTIGLPLDSDTLHTLREDSEETGVSIPQLLAVRIADWYQFIREMKQAVPIHSEPVLESEKALAKAQGYPNTNGTGLQTRAAAAAAAWGVREDA